MDQPGALPSKIRHAFEAHYRQQRRLLRLETPLGPDALVPVRLQGREALSECDRLTLDCIAPTAHFKLEQLLGQPLTLHLQTADATSRVWHGLAGEAAYLGSDGGLAHYQLQLVPWLARLAYRRDCRIFQNKTALEIIEQVLSAWFEADFRAPLTHKLALRPRCTQYRETDLAFIERLLAEEGLCYRFQHDPAHSAAGSHSRPLGPVMIIFDPTSDTPATDPPVIRFHRAAAPEQSDTITAWADGAQVTPTACTLSAWDAQQLRAHAGHAEAADAFPHMPALPFYDGSRSALRLHSAPAVQQQAERQLTALQARARTIRGEGSARGMAAGHRFELTGHPSADGAYTLWAVEHEATNNLGGPLARLLGQSTLATGCYRNQFMGAPEATPVRPVDPHKPTAPQLETARVVGLANHTLTSHRDHRVKVQFNWQRGEHPNPGGLFALPEQSRAPGDERAGTWVRVAESQAGPNWGSIFTPRIGTEVLIEYLEGDIDQPIVVGQVYNGVDRPPLAGGPDSHANHPGTLSGIHSQARDGTGHNQWVHDDTRGQLRQRLASTHADSALNLGYLIHQHGATRGQYRGIGAELKTAGWAALRAPEGLLLSASARSRGQSVTHDITEATGQLKAAHELAERLSGAADAQQARALKANRAQKDFIAGIDVRQDGHYNGPVGGQDSRKPRPGSRQPRDPADRLARPYAVFEGPGALTTTTPASSLFQAGHNTHTTVQGETQHSAAQTYSEVTGGTSSWYTHDGGLQGVAAHGDTTLQAHDDDLTIRADDTVTVTSSDDRIDIRADDTIELRAGRARIRLHGDRITFACPGTFTVHGGAHTWNPPSGRPATLTDLPSGTVDFEGKSLDEAATSGEELAYSGNAAHFEDLPPKAMMYVINQAYGRGVLEIDPPLITEVDPAKYTKTVDVNDNPRFTTQDEATYNRLIRRELGLRPYQELNSDRILNASPDDPDMRGTTNSSTSHLRPVATIERYDSDSATIARFFDGRPSKGVGDPSSVKEVNPEVRPQFSRRAAAGSLISDVAGVFEKASDAHDLGKRSKATIYENTKTHQRVVAIKDFHENIQGTALESSQVSRDQVDKQLNSLSNSGLSEIMQKIQSEKLDQFYQENFKNNPLINP